MMRDTVRLLLLSTVLALGTGCQKGGGTRFVTIGTGGVTGVYYPTGGAISRMVNRKSRTYRIKATVESTAGSVYNINAVLSGDLDFGIAQSDRQYQALKGLAEWKEQGEQAELRSVFSIHPEAVTLVASVKSGIKTMADLAGKRVNLGNPGSGQLQNARDAIQAFGLSEDDLSANYVKAVEAPGLLQDERIDAFFYTVGHPNGNIKEATAGRVTVHFVPIVGPEVDSLIAAKPYYAPASIPHDAYPRAENTADVPTFGVKATFVTAARTPEAVVYVFTKEVFANLKKFKKLHPAYAGLTTENMLQGLSAPLHPGAVRYYREAGLIGAVDTELLGGER
jgi:TRAP transporter TAXI family solute receptor